MHFNRIIISLSLIFLSFSANAAHWAVLVGVSDYGPRHSLEGPKYDLPAVKQTLLDQWDFSEENIVTLFDKNATKDNIVNTLKTLETRTAENDFIFLYFSGHGTSAMDANNKVALPTTSGAFIPYDFRFSKGVPEMSQRLLVGRRDLRPILEKLETKNRTIFVAMDACYSGNTVRGSHRKKPLPTRAVRVSQLFPERAFGDDLAQFASKGAWETKKSDIYPYENIYYLSAAGEHEVAQDIPKSRLDEFKTIDNKPHGAFTDTLLVALNHPEKVDANKDGQISYVELKQWVRTTMVERKFSHTPQGLPTAANDKRSLGTQPVMQQVFANGKPQEHTIQTALKVKIEKELTVLKTLLSSIPESQVVDKGHDLEIRATESELQLISAAGDILLTMAKNESGRMLNQIQYLHFLQGMKKDVPTNHLTVQFDLQGATKGSTVQFDDILGFDVKTDTKAYIMILDYDSSGNITVLYPYTDQELAPIGANSPLAIHDITKVVPPAGIDSLFLYAFKNPVPEITTFKGSTFHYSSNQAKILHKVLEKNAHHSARATMDLVVIEKE